MTRILEGRFLTARQRAGLRRSALPLGLVLAGFAHAPFLGAAGPPGVPDVPVAPAPAPPHPYLYPTWAALLAAFAAHPDQEPHFQALHEARDQAAAAGVDWGAEEQATPAAVEAAEAVDQALSVLRSRLNMFVILAMAGARIDTAVVIANMATIGTMQWATPAAAPALPAVEG